MKKTILLVLSFLFVSCVVDAMTLYEYPVLPTSIKNGVNVNDEILVSMPKIESADIEKKDKLYLLDGLKACIQSMVILDEHA